MALTAETGSKERLNQHALIIGPMGVVTAGTGQFPPGAQSFTGCRHRVIGDRMSPRLQNHLGMAAFAEFVGRFLEHELLISGVGIMTNDTALTGNHAVDE